AWPLSAARRTVVGLDRRYKETLEELFEGENMLDETTRRGFFKTTAAAGAASGMLVATPELSANETNVYTRLGVRPVINAAGVLTYLGGSLMPPEVVRAMEEASKHFVQIPELQKKV